MAHFEIRDLTFTYNTLQGLELKREGKSTRPALDHVTLDIKQGEYITVCGKSGSGKTTLIKMLKPVLMPAGEMTGEILLDGKALKDADGRIQARTVGYVMQDPEDQIVTDKVWHELAFGLENIGTDPQIIRTKVAEMASYFGIQSWFERDVSELSGGQKQLLNLASVMAMQPSVLVLDEPTSQLDPIAASDFLNTVRKINLELGTTIVITEHRLEDIFPFSDKVVVMEEGKAAFTGSPREVAGMLNAAGSDMFKALPSPARIYYGAKTEPHEAGNCPMNIRDGRNWLSEKCAGMTAEKKPLNAAKADKKNILSVRDLWFRYEKNGADILKGTELNIQEGCTYALVGGNGTGKSTLLKCICRVCRPYRGRITINGTDVMKYKGRELFRHNLAMLPQDPRSLFAKQSVREDLEEMLGAQTAGRLERLEEIHGSDSVELDSRVAEAAALCDIESLLDRHPYDLSGGELQRAALAKVLLAEPEILLLDEPTKGMDCAFKARLGELIGTLNSRKITVMIVSHDIEFCARYADRVGMLFNGEVVSENDPGRFFSTNSFYTTAANRMARHIFPDAVTVEDVIREIER